VGDPGGDDPKERAERAWGSVRERLVQDYGVLLLEPAYTVPDPKIGYLSRYAPGSRENGGVYMHAAVWALAAACKRRDIETVERIWRGVSPPLRSADADAYAAEPYVTPGNVDGPLSDTPGRAGWTWYTGSAAWLHRVAVEWVLGVRATWEGLRIDPCPFPALGEVDVSADVARAAGAGAVRRAVVRAGAQRLQLEINGARRRGLRPGREDTGQADGFAGTR
jgi:cellobiose phosphorylase